jgi:hypothetical protein
MCWFCNSLTRECMCDNVPDAEIVRMGSISPEQPPYDGAAEFDAWLADILSDMPGQ